MLLPFLADRLNLERNAEEAVLSPGGEDGLLRYVEGPLRRQVNEERAGNMPYYVTLVLGHTHKPFTRLQAFKGYPQATRVYNAGAWSVDGMEPRPLHGANLVLIDEDLHDAALRLYNEGKSPEAYQVKIEPLEPGAASNPLHENLLKMVNPDQDPWKSFSHVVAENVHERLRLKVERQYRLRSGLDLA